MEYCLKLSYGSSELLRDRSGSSRREVARTRFSGPLRWSVQTKPYERFEPGCISPGGGGGAEAGSAGPTDRPGPPGWAGRAGWTVRLRLHGAASADAGGFDGFSGCGWIRLFRSVRAVPAGPTGSTSTSSPAGRTGACGCSRSPGNPSKLKILVHLPGLDHGPASTLILSATAQTRG